MPAGRNARSAGAAGRGGGLSGAEMTKRNDRDSRIGLLINLTGDGKGKTTGALGCCMRALGWDWEVSVIQFIKDARETGEKRFAAAIPHLEMIQIGLGMTCNSAIPEERHRETAVLAWEKAKSCLAGGKVDLLVLDELNAVLDLGWLDLAEVIRELQRRPAWMQVIVTGRHAPERLLAVSDLVSEIRAIKHPFDSGVKAGRGTEY